MKGEKVEKTKTKSRHRHEGRLGESSSTAGSMMPPGRRKEERIRKENAKATTAKLSLAPAYHHEETTPSSPSLVSSEQPNNDDESKTKAKETTASKAAAKPESKTARKSKTKAKETTASKDAKRESRRSRKSKTKSNEATASKDANRESRTSGKSSLTWRQRRELEDDASVEEDVVMEEDDEDTRPGATSVGGSSITTTTNEIDEELGHHHRKPSTFSTSINDTIAEEEGTTMSEKGISGGGGGGGGGGDSSLKPFTVEATLVEEGMRPEDREQIEKEIRNELLDNVVVGEAMIVDDDSKRTSSSSSKKCWLVILLAAILLIIGIVAGIVVGKNGEEVVGNKAETEPPTATEPTIDISTPSPTTSPTLPEPTWSPTISIENLDNGNITEAHPLVLRGTTPLEDSGSNFQFQAYGGTSAACDLRRNDKRDLATRDLATWFAETYGLWYIYRSRTSGPVTAVLCGSNGYDLELFSGEGRHGVCSTMENGDLGNCGGTSVSWIAQEGLSYYVLAHDYDNVIFDPYSIEIVDNDKCQFAFGPITPTSAGVVMSYSTTNAEIDTEVNDSSCGGASAGGGPGVWYLVEGTGRPLTASTCSDGTTFDTQISVFGGTSRAPCESLTCINGNNDFCGKASSVTWPSQIGEVYYVLVQGATIDDVGDFELTISTDADRVDNDFCATAEVLGTDEVSFSFSGSTADDVPVCSNEVGSWNSDLEPGQQENLPYGLWYSFVGDGSNFGYEVYVPDEAPIVIKVLSPVSIGCGDLACVEEAESGGWGVVGYSYSGHCIPTVPGQIYYIFIATRHSENIDVVHSITTPIFGCS